MRASFGDQHGRLSSLVSEALDLSDRLGLTAVGIHLDSARLLLAETDLERPPTGAPPLEGADTRRVVATPPLKP